MLCAKRPCTRMKAASMAMRIDWLPITTRRHSAEEYVRYEGDRTVHTNTVEGYYSIFKRGMTGIYQHCSEKHLHRYLAEFDFRYSNRIRLGIDDTVRTAKALKGAAGKRLSYRNPHGTQAGQKATP